MQLFSKENILRFFKNISLKKSLPLFLFALLLGSALFFVKNYLATENEMLTAGLFGSSQKEEAASSENTDCAEDPECVEFFYNGEGTRIGKRLNEDNYTLYITPTLQKEVIDGKVRWKKFYSVKGETKAVRVISEE